MPHDRNSRRGQFWFSDPFLKVAVVIVELYQDPSSVLGNNLHLQYPQRVAMRAVDVKAQSSCRFTIESANHLCEMSDGKYIK